MTALEEDNSQYDSDAKDCTVDDVSSTSFQSSPGYRAMLKLNGQWVTTQFRNYVKFANVAPQMAEYIKGRLDINDATFQLINWQGTYISHSIRRKVRTIKMMYQWLPVGRNWTKFNIETDKCRCCGAKDEAFKHLLLCKHDDLKKPMKAAYIMIHTRRSAS